MTPASSSSSDGNQLPPRHRPVLGELAKDTTELDLWDFDVDLSLPEDSAPPRPDGGRAGGGDIPAPREPRKPTAPAAEESPLPRTPPPGGEGIRMNVNRTRQSERPAGPVPRPAAAESEFDDLDHWEDVTEEPDIGDLPAELPPAVESVPATARPVPSAEPETVEAPAVEAAAPAPVPETVTPPAADDEFTPVPRPDAQPVSLRPHLKLSQIERIGLISLVVLLVVTAGAAYLFSLNRLPRESDRVRTTDFPIRGERLTVTAARTYWRAPITEGPEADTFRRGTELLPVLEIDLDGGPAAIRVLFRNEDRGVVGDAVTRSVKAHTALKIAATAGFDDPGMHAAYRTGESKPWTIEVYEAPTEDAAGRDFKKIFEMEISTDLR